MRYIRYAFLGILAIILISVSLANRGFVTLSLLPLPLAELFQFDPRISLPLFVVVLGGIAAGLIIGFIWEWMREFKYRRKAGQSTAQMRKLEREVTKLKDEKHQGKDEVLAILDEAG